MHRSSCTGKLKHRAEKESGRLQTAPSRPTKEICQTYHSPATFLFEQSIGIKKKKDNNPTFPLLLQPWNYKKSM